MAVIARITPTSDPGSGQVHDPEKEALDAIIAMVNDLFVGDLTPGDKLVYVNNAIKGKLLECEVLIQQAVNNTKEQFASSPDLDPRWPVKFPHLWSLQNPPPEGRVTER